MEIDFKVKMHYVRGLGLCLPSGASFSISQSINVFGESLFPARTSRGAADAVDIQCSCLESPRDGGAS